MKKISNTFYIHTLGCKANRCESDDICAIAKEQGWQRVDDMRAAALHIINTCTVTEHADATSRKILRRMARANPDAPRLVIGCYAHTNFDLSENPDANSVIITFDAEDVVAEMNAYFDTLPVPPRAAEVNKDKEKKYSQKNERTRTFIKIQDGCDQYCSYCKVPYARNIPRSHKLNYILNAVRHAVENGAKECVLTGINIGRYASDNMNLAALIQRIDAEKCVPRLRISSVEPQSCTDELLKTFTTCSTLLPHLHIPLQSGSDAILRAMNRPVTRAQMEAVFNTFLSVHPLATVSTDCIVGFPGETDKDFDDTLALIDAFPFCKVHIFRFSPREYTKALKMKEKFIPQTVVRERENVLIQHAETSAKKCRAAFENNTFSVLIEEKIKDEWYGLSENYLRIATTREDLSANSCVELSMLSPDTRFVYPA